MARWRTGTGMQFCARNFDACSTRADQGLQFLSAATTTRWQHADSGLPTATVGGSKVDQHDDRAYGPILFTLYTASRGVLKLSAQFPPLEDTSSPATLQIRDQTGAWNSIATANLDKDAWNATFRIPEWDATREQEYRVLYSLRDGNGGCRQYSFGGTIRKEPTDSEDITVGLLTCIWDFGFPHTDFTNHLAYHKPEILFWTGDQIYEPVGGYGVIESRAPDALEPAMLDFLRKWFIFGWATGGLTRNIPSVCMTDDHDMYHGNIWGCGGRPTNPALGERGYAGQDSGGYKMPPRWVNMVQRAQTAHLPDPFDPTPVLQHISVYYTDLQWGGISFAILEDRKWKSAPKVELPGADIVNGFAQNPAWDAATQSNAPDAQLLGQRQLDFLESWAEDWSGGTWMKFAVSQTPFVCLHTEPAGINTDKEDPEERIPPVGVYIQGDHIVADHDSGAWPQHGRDDAIRKLRKDLPRIFQAINTWDRLVITGSTGLATEFIPCVHLRFQTYFRADGFHQIQRRMHCRANRTQAITGTPLATALLSSLRQTRRDIPGLGWMGCVFA